MKLARLELTPELFIEFCKAAQNGKPRQFIVKANPLPDDVEITRVWMGNRGNLELYLMSESFEDTTDPPLLESPIFETVYSER